MGRTKPTISNDYIVGLTDGEGCFYVNKSNLKTYTSGVRIQLHFHLKLRECDKEILEKIKDTLECGGVYFQKEQRKNHTPCYRYTVASQQDIFEKIIPFFQKNPLQTVSKQKSFVAFCKIAELIKMKKHLTQEGIEEIVSLKQSMNNRTVGIA